MHFTVYTSENCSRCSTVKNVISMYQLEADFLKVGEDIKMEEFIKLTGGTREVPQVFLNGKRIGGLDDFKIHVKTVMVGRMGK